MEGSVEHEYKNQDPNLNVSGISVSTKLSLVFVSCDHSEAVAIVVYSLSEDHALFTFHVAADSYFLKIGLNDVNRVFTVAMVGEVGEYSKTSLFTFSHLKEELSSRLNRDDWDNLRSYFSLPPGQVSTITGSQSYSENTLLLLEERGYIHPSNVDRLSDAFADLSLQHAYLVTQTFKNLGAQENEYGRFLASLATHLTLEIQEKLWAYFQFTEENMKSVFSNQSPALSFLLTLDDMGKIHPADVSNLRTPLRSTTFYRL
ncbi:hypothetical protein BSL78_16716 [Apostichopus japonicus]|uniref:Uncharacterized protein n=1 Tax=Stichopus japonicus TaxID=307972 RepID=A0A2G8KEN5_STIJA|nr:hypothetical protein BSL78_16716 [Apostichopus japonicus]